MIYAPVFYTPHYPSSYPSKKKQLFFIHFAFSLSISKKCCVVDICICLLFRQYNAISEKRKTHRQRYGLTCSYDKNTDERCHHRRNVGKNC